MPDLVIDTCFLGDMLADCLPATSVFRTYGRFRQSSTLPPAICRKLDAIVGFHEERWDISGSTVEVTSDIGVVVVSSFAFIELIRKWAEIVNNRFSPLELYTFLLDLPDWMSVAEVDEDMLPSYAEVPTDVWIDDNQEPIELPDAVHVATVLSRGDDTLFATSDTRLRALPFLAGRIIPPP